MSAGEPRITGPTLKVLGALLSSGGVELSGADIARATNLASGTLYPILFRLERAGWLESRWEEKDDPRTLGRPRRRLYQVRALGARNARAAVKDLGPGFRNVAWG
jgi:DNA-binding PadR family transcriptional regulator